VRKRTLPFLALAVVLAARPGFGQGATTGNLSGQVMADGAAAEGVTVTAASPALQGERTTITSATGAYSLTSLPPGTYTIVFELEGLERQVHTVNIAATRATALDVEMSAQAIADTITVSASADSVSTTPQLSTTITNSLIDELPVNRDVRQATLLSAGVSTNPSGGSNATPGISIAGAPTYQGLFMVNGVVVNENLRGQPLNLFIEDAIQETTISVSGISAEYGRFAGGVVNTITKSGGNELSGSFRTVITNDDWVGRNPHSPERIDDINQRYEATLGGFLLRDRLWYFLAGRHFETKSTASLLETGTRYINSDEQTRPEFKLTAALGERHRLVGSYLAIDEVDGANNFLLRAVDVESLDDRKLPQEFTVASYSGVLTPNLTAEAQWSERKFTFEGSGSQFTDRIRGTWIEDGVEVWRYNSPTFCGVCTDEGRDNENLLAKLTWFAPTAGGSHELTLGVDRYNDIRAANNFQSGSNFSMFSTTTLFRDGQPIPVFDGDGSAVIVYWPIAEETQGTDFITNSAYVNDRWRINDRWSVNLGVRYDHNDGKNAADQRVADDYRFSPRLGLSYDLRGDGDWIFNASYGHYVTSLANNIADSTSTAGTPSIFVWEYRGPALNTDPNAPLLSTHEVLGRVFDWFDASGGVNGNTRDLIQVTIPGGSTVIDRSLQSPYAEEIQLGVSKQLGPRGALRVDAIHRRYADFYTSNKDLSTGRITLPSGAVVDRGLLVNIDDDSVLERTYSGLLTTFRYRWDRFVAGGAYTLSRLEGNHVGETQGAGPINSFVTEYPEYKQQRWNAPKGDLSGDQRHVLRLWGVATLLDNERHRLTASVLQSYNSGLPYGAAGAVNPRDASGRFGIPNPGYASNNTPQTVAYFYTARDAFRTDDITETDLSFNYSFQWPLLGQDIEVFLQPEILNVFGEDGAWIVNTAIQDPTTGSGLARFNPFTETPVEGVHWRKGPNFGRPTAEDHYQTPRTFRFSVGFRF
jgi:outer membrane receptor protein involved in Fe transport